MDDELCNNNCTLFVKLASGPRCFKKEWAKLNARIRLSTVVPQLGADVRLQILGVTLIGHNQFQTVPKRSLLPVRPSNAKEQVIVLSGVDKGNLGSVVRIEGTRVTVGPLNAKATRNNITYHDVDNLTVARK